MQDQQIDYGPKRYVMAGVGMGIYGAPLPEGATSAPATAQVAGLHDIFVVIVGLIALGLVPGIWALVWVRRTRHAAVSEIGS